MPREKLMPDKETLTKWLLDEGLTRQQVVDRIFEEKGVRPTLQAVSMARREYGIPLARDRYDDLIPWRVRGEHEGHKYHQLLRKLGRRKAGLPLRDSDETWLDNFLEELRASGAVIAYFDDTDEGFYPVPRVPEDGGGPFDVIRRPHVQDLLDQREAG